MVQTSRDDAGRIRGMGAVLHEEGAAFRVWAPHADRVFVMGDFNGWSKTDSPMENEGSGYWYADIGGAKAGQEYKFLVQNGELDLERIDPYARQVTNSVGSGIIYDPDGFDWQGDDFVIPAHNELIIYEMHIGSFFTTEDGQPGSFDTALEKLDHLVRLGVNAVQVMPIAEFAGDYSWGYNPAHIFAVESAYGGPDGFKNFVREAHRRGLAVILDVVYNHFGPSDLDLWQFDGWQENDKGGIYFYNDHRSETPWGDTRPDYGRPEVRQFILDNALMWLEEYHIDGLRYDMILYIRSVHGGDEEIPEGWSLMQWINQTIHERFPERILIAEDLRDNSAVTADVEHGGAGFHSQWDARFVHPIREAVIVAEDALRSMEAVSGAITFGYEGDAFHRVVYSESHDEVANGKARVPQEVSPDDPTGWYAQKRSTLAAGLVFTVPGIPMLFQGQEFLQGEWFRDDVPLDWDLKEDFHGLVRLYRDLARLRLNRGGVTRGLCGQHVRVFHLNEDEKVIAFQRWDEHGPGDDVVVVANFGNAFKEDYVIGLPGQGVWRLRCNSDAVVYSDDFGDSPAGDIDAREGEFDGLPASGALSIGPYTVLIYSQDRPE
ncbi:alpha-amylase family glycosyl hydrolase [Desulfomicrobium orale]|uniref:1,4-alpha-glucan branching enzyme n=1 Tax=Desulfomicrobium orale DSM 12838 TaxID=888061 RepID=A0A109W5N6_9BACT|nr:alpha-amylase family glycosyl hydrolase [Desulfomicrobium orale]AMD92418.1 1,4-alpha-glucan branching protein [Desulfomicrobium orale DSM 12838]